MEHRWGLRVPLNQSVLISTAPMGTRSARLRDVSVSGAFLDTDLDLPHAARLFVQVREYSLEAHLVRHTPEGIGIEWCEFAPACVADLMQEETMAETPDKSERVQQQLDDALADTFPASDPVSIVSSQDEEFWHDAAVEPRNEADGGARDESGVKRPA